MAPIRIMVICHVPSCAPVSLSVCPVIKGIVAAVRVPIHSHNATALEEDVQRDEVFSAVHVFRCFRIKSRKASIIFVMSVRPSVRMNQRGSHWMNFREI
jgi:hypothetical protein